MLDEQISVVVAAPPMRIGGTQQHLLHILPALAKRGFAITAVLLEAGGPLEQPLRDGGVQVLAPALHLPRPLRTLNQARLIRRTIRQTNAAIVHAFLSEPSIAAAVAQITLLDDRPCLIHGRRSLAFYSNKHRLAQKIEVAAHRLCGALVGNSSAVVQELIVEARSPDKVCLIHNGIPLGEAILPAERQAARLRFGIPADALVMTLVANLHIYKGHQNLLVALAYVKDRLPDAWRLLLPGRDSGEGKALAQSIQQLGLTQNVLMLGEWPNSREPYAAADIGLLVSHTEGFSNSLIEGMAAGLPMIATRVGGNIDAIDNGTTGLLVAPQSPDDLASAIMKLVKSVDLRDRLGHAARIKALDKFSLQNCIDRYERLWRGFAGKQSGRPADWLF